MALISSVIMYYKSNSYRRGAPKGVGLLKAAPPNPPCCETGYEPNPCRVGALARAPKLAFPNGLAPIELPNV